MTSDDLLVRDSMKGDEEAFRLLVDRYRNLLHHLAVGILQDRDLAADAVQDVFLKAYSSLSDYRGKGLFQAWIRRILVNHCLSVLRQRHSYLSLDELDRDFADRDRGPEEATLARNDSDALRQAMARLPANYRAALVLRAVEGLSYREISELLGVPESTVESWIHRGRMRMRTLIAPDGQTTPSTGPRARVTGWDRR